MHPCLMYVHQHAMQHISSGQLNKKLSHIWHQIAALGSWCTPLALGPCEAAGVSGSRQPHTFVAVGPEEVVNFVTSASQKPGILVYGCQVCVFQRAKHEDCLL